MAEFNWGSGVKSPEEELKDIPLLQVDQAKWPPGVRGIGFDETDGFGVDAAGTLYWQGKPVEIRRPLELSKWQSWLGAAAALSAVVLALWDTLRFFGFALK